MKTKFLSLLALVFLFACTTIVFDEGGVIRDYQSRVAEGNITSISGYCASACTMYLATACVTPSPTLVFHGPTNYFRQLPPRYFEYWSEVLASYYPEPLAEWYMSEGRYGWNTLNYEQLVELGATPC
jgi:hypothetical protein